MQGALASVCYDGYMSAGRLNWHWSLKIASVFWKQVRMACCRWGPAKDWLAVVPGVSIASREVSGAWSRRRPRD